ncbi:hypothetical protein ACO0RG_003185 [Hanseniaspora osmophila]
MDSFLEADPWASEADNKNPATSSPFHNTNTSIFTSKKDDGTNSYHGATSSQLNAWNTHNLDELVASNSSITNHTSATMSPSNSDENLQSRFGNLSVGNMKAQASVWGNELSNSNLGSLFGGARSVLENNLPGSSSLSYSKQHETPNTVRYDTGAINEREDGEGEDNGIEDDEETNEDDFKAWLASIRRLYNPLYYDLISIEELPEREGLLFKHTNYLVKYSSGQPATKKSVEGARHTDGAVGESGSSRGKVIRRYSDFVWLQSVLLKKYPFRLIPELPQKMIGSQNTDPVFLERRRLGLARFANLVMKHPVLKNDDLVITFLTVPTDLSSWRKNAPYDTTEEFLDKKIDKSFIKMWKPRFSRYWNELDNSLDLSLEYWTKMTVLIERYERRQRAAAQERYFLKQTLSKFSKESTKKLYPLDSHGLVNDINEHLGYVGKHLENCVALTLKENEEVRDTLSEKFKTFIEILFSMKGLFERYKMLAGNNVLQLQRRVELNEEKLKIMREKADIKGATYDKLEDNITEDKKTIAEQINRSWLIKECILEEFAIFHETMFLITNLFQKWAVMYSKYCDLESNEWDKLLGRLESMPTHR